MELSDWLGLATQHYYSTLELTNLLPTIASYLTVEKRMKLHYVTTLPTTDPRAHANDVLQSLVESSRKLRLHNIMDIPLALRLFVPPRAFIEVLYRDQHVEAAPGPDSMTLLGMAARNMTMEVMRVNPAYFEVGNAETTLQDNGHFAFTRSWIAASNMAADATTWCQLLQQISTTLQTRLDAFPTQPGSNIHAIILLLSDVIFVISGVVRGSPMQLLFLGTHPAEETAESAALGDTDVRRLLLRIAVLIGIGFDKVKAELVTVCGGEDSDRASGALKLILRFTVASVANPIMGWI